MFQILMEFLKCTSVALTNMKDTEAKLMLESQNCRLTQDEIISILATSILAPMMNKVRACCENPLKNKHMAR